MSIQFTPIALIDIRDAVKRHLTSLPAAIDSFLEDHIAASAHYQIRVEDQIAGFASIHKESLITQFVLEAPFKRDGQRIYSQVRKLEQVQAALVPTCDEFFLAHALDEYRQLAKQAYFFAADPSASNGDVQAGFTLRLAESADIAMIRDASGDFFGDIEKYVSRRGLFLTLRQGSCVGFGILDRSELAGNVASIGMYIIERFRRQGAGTATLRLLQGECQRDGLRPVAGCWYYNHFSKKTLERAGMFTQTRLLRIEY